MCFVCVYTYARIDVDIVDTTFCSFLRPVPFYLVPRFRVASKAYQGAGEPFLDAFKDEHCMALVRRTLHAEQTLGLVSLALFHIRAALDSYVVY